jgi:hypothetical protein
MSEHPALRMIQHSKDCPPDMWERFYGIISYLAYMVSDGASKELLKPQRDQLASFIKGNPELRINYKEYVLPNQQH